MANNPTGNDPRFHFNLTGEQKEPIQIELREGPAEKLFEPHQFRLNVLVGSIAEYIEKHPISSEEAEFAAIIASIDIAGPFIEYRENVNSPLGTVLRADLREHPDFTAWGINDDKQFTMRELEKHVRKYAHCFTDPEQAKNLIRSLQNFEVKYEQLVSKEDDRQGKTKDLRETAIKFSKGELPKQLTLNMPLFKGTPAQTITLEVEVDKGTGNMPVFSFYSMDVELLAREVVEKTIEREIDKFRELFPILYV